MLAGYNRLGSEEFGSIAFNQADILPPFVNILGTAVSTDDYGIDSDVQFYSKSDAEEWNWLRVGSTGLSVWGCSIRYGMVPAHHQRPTVYGR